MLDQRFDCTLFSAVLLKKYTYKYFRKELGIVVYIVQYICIYIHQYVYVGMQSLEYVTI